MKPILYFTKTIYILAILIAILSYYSFAPYCHHYYIFLALLLFIYLIDHNVNSKIEAICLGYLIGIFYFGLQFYWIFYSLYYVIDTGLLIAIVGFIIFIIFIASYIALISFIYYTAKSSSKIINLTILLPSIWTLAEWLKSWLFTGFPWGDIGYTQVDTDFLKGIYTIFGHYAVSWLVVSISASIYLLSAKLFNVMHIISFIVVSSKIFKNRANYRQINVDANIIKNYMQLFLNHVSPQNKKNLYIYLLGIFLFGSLSGRINFTKTYGAPLKAALVQANINIDSKYHNNNFLQIFIDLLQKTSADVVLFSETAISRFEAELPPRYLSQLQDIAHAHSSELVVGMPKIINQQNDYVNAAILLTPNKAQNQYYAKAHLVPYGEYIPMQWLLKKLYKIIQLPLVSFSAGKIHQSPIIIKNQNFMFNICYENGFNSEISSNAKNANIMANLSDMIWYGNTIAKDQHLQISQARALENQRYFIQATNNGNTAIINDHGIIEAQLPAFERDILYGIVDGKIGYTPFEIMGNYPIIIFSLLILLYSLKIKIYRFSFRNIS